MLEQVAVGSRLERIEDSGLVGERGQHEHPARRVVGGDLAGCRRYRRSPASTGPSARHRGACSATAFEGLDAVRGASRRSSMSAVVARSCSSPERTTTWSSTISTRIFGVSIPLRASSLQPGVDRNGNLDLVPVPGPTVPGSGPPRSAQDRPATQADMTVRRLGRPMCRWRTPGRCRRRRAASVSSTIELTRTWVAAECVTTLRSASWAAR